MIEALTLARWSSVDMIADDEDKDPNTPDPPDFRDGEFSVYNSCNI